MLIVSAFSYPAFFNYFSSVFREFFFSPRYANTSPEQRRARNWNYSRWKRPQGQTATSGGVSLSVCIRIRNVWVIAEGIYTDSHKSSGGSSFIDRFSCRYLFYIAHCRKGYWDVRHLRLLEKNPLKHLLKCLGEILRISSQPVGFGTAAVEHRLRR